jgi:hypothetical protein
MYGEDIALGCGSKLEERGKEMVFVEQSSPKVVLGTFAGCVDWLNGLATENIQESEKKKIPTTA